MTNTILRHLKIVAIGVLFALAGCTTTREQRCRQWQNEGKFYGSVGSCAQCVETLGEGNIDAIQGCAVGLDAAKLLQS